MKIIAGDHAFELFDEHVGFPTVITPCAQYALVDETYAWMLAEASYYDLALIFSSRRINVY